MTSPSELQQWIHAADAEALANVEQRQQQEADFHRALKLEQLKNPACLAIYALENCRLAGYTGQILISEQEITEDP